MGKHYSHKEFVEKFMLTNPQANTIIFNSQYETATKKISCECLKCGDKWEAYSGNLLSKKSGCPRCSAQKAGISKRITKDEYLSRVNKNNPNLELLEDFKGLDKRIRVRCNSCGYTWKAISRSLMTIKCPCCTNRITIKGINDIATTHPDWLIFFKNKSDAERYTECSGKYIDTMCPCCGYERKIQISKIYTYGYKCNNCFDGFSYPNKIIRSIFQQLSDNNQINVNDYKFEYTSDWTLNYRYDVWFRTTDNKEYLIEMDGGQHYFNKDPEKLLKQQKIDKCKDELANQNGYSIIRINCQKSDANYIIANIMVSQLCTIFDLSIIDVVKCHTFAKTNLMKRVIEYYNNNDNIDYQIMSEIFKVDISTIRRWVKQASKYGICNFIQHHHKPVYMYDANLLLVKKFDTLKSASQYLVDNGIFTTNNIKGGADKIAKYIKSQKILCGFRFSHENIIN